MHFQVQMTSSNRLPNHDQHSIFQDIVFAFQVGFYYNKCNDKKWYDTKLRMNSTVSILSKKFYLLHLSKVVTLRSNYNKHIFPVRVCVYGQFI